MNLNTINSGWHPPSNPPGPLVNDRTQQTRLQHRDVFTVTGHNNLTVGERKALKELQNMASIVIKSANKGRTIVVQLREQYLQEELRQLADTKFYTKEKLDTTDTHKTTINEFLTTMYENSEIDFTV